MTKYDSFNMSCQHFCNGGCLHPQKLCNGITDCQDGSDEKNCEPKKCHSPDGKGGYQCPTEEDRCGGNVLCIGGGHMSKSLGSCPEAAYVNCKINAERVCISKMCDGVIDCSDGSDENLFCSN
ncbi:hypothetical protein RF11_15639 [Thelohanellus kitauei]|uniref:Uncharacterized protein n=1 Tax=Thelohanellus kitauei TaxID=669202 RepID=A0A0C2N8A3_THEKT|nr:hypothetical protein RF11_15639 [Thelohanellus kitauei]